MPGKLTEAQRQAISLQREFPYWIMVYGRTNQSDFIKVRNIVKHQGVVRTAYRNTKTGLHKFRAMFNDPILRDRMAEELHETYRHIAIQDNPQKRGKRNPYRARAR